MHIIIHIYILVGTKKRRKMKKMEKTILEVEEGAEESHEIMLPREVMDKLGLKEGDTISYEKHVKGVCIFKVERD